jgi:hypothetical protein
MAKKRTHKKIPAIIRFWRFIQGDPGVRDCWRWTGAHTPSGYPTFHVNKGKPPVHAVHFAFEAIRGEKRPRRGSGKELSHTCKTGARCTNPWHVVPESHSENMHRSIDLMRKLAARARTFCVRVARTPTCHPDRKHHSKGLCNACHQAALKATGYYQTEEYKAKCRAYYKERMKDPEYRQAYRDATNARYAERTKDPEYRAKRNAAHNERRRAKKALLGNPSPLINGAQGRPGNTLSALTQVDQPPTVSGS